MIRYTLACDNAHVFDGWFSSGADFDDQAERGLVSCAVCGSASVAKQLMTPALSTDRRMQASRSLVMEATQKQMVEKLREIVTTIRESAEDVGDSFPEEARKVHYGETEARGLIGKATPAEARALIDEGIAVAPLPVLPDDVN